MNVREAPRSIQLPTTTPYCKDWQRYCLIAPSAVNAVVTGGSYFFGRWDVAAIAAVVTALTNGFFAYVLIHPEPPVTPRTVRAYEELNTQNIAGVVNATTTADELRNQAAADNRTAAAVSGSVGIDINTVDRNSQEIRDLNAGEKKDGKGLEASLLLATQSERRGEVDVQKGQIDATAAAEVVKRALAADKLRHPTKVNT